MITSENTVKLFLTATYNKPLREWNIEDEQIYKGLKIPGSGLTSQNFRRNKR